MKCLRIGHFVVVAPFETGVTAAVMAKRVFGRAAVSDVRVVPVTSDSSIDSDAIVMHAKLELRNLPLSITLDAAFRTRRRIVEGCVNRKTMLVLQETGVRVELVVSWGAIRGHSAKFMNCCTTFLLRLR